MAFPRDAAVEALTAGEIVEFEGFRLELDGSGLRAFAADDTEIAAHQAFWFAWSQFWPETELWSAES